MSTHPRLRHSFHSSSGNSAVYIVELHSADAWKDERVNLRSFVFLYKSCSLHINKRFRVLLFAQRYFNVGSWFHHTLNCNARIINFVVRSWCVKWKQSPRNSSEKNRREESLFESRSIKSIILLTLLDTRRLQFNLCNEKTFEADAIWVSNISFMWWDVYKERKFT